MGQFCVWIIRYCNGSCGGGGGIWVVLGCGDRGGGGGGRRGLLREAKENYHGCGRGERRCDVPPWKLQEDYEMRERELRRLEVGTF